MTAVCLLGSVALSLSSGNTCVVGNALLVDLLADESWHGSGVEGKCWGRAVGAAKTGEVKGCLNIVSAYVDGIQSILYEELEMNSLLHHRCWPPSFRCKEFHMCSSGQRTIDLIYILAFNGL